MSTTSSTISSNSSHGALSAARLNVQGTASKEVRAHEHARHRTKERREHALTKERKEKAATAKVLGLKMSHGTKLVRKLSMESWDGEDPEERTAFDMLPIENTAEPAPVQAVQPRNINTSASTALTLGDVISKPRKVKAKQLDFEVIPPIRHVIALDDVEADEPWEYITRASLNDGSAWKGKSYAQAVSAM